MSTNEENDGLSSTGQNSLPVHNNCDESQDEEVFSVPNTKESKEIIITDDLNQDADQVIDQVVEQDAEQVVKQDGLQVADQDMKQGGLQVAEQEEEHRDVKSTNENIFAAYPTRKGKEESTNEEIVSRIMKDGVEVVSVRNDEDHPNTIPGICFNAGTDTGDNGAETTKEDYSTSISRKKVENMKDEFRELLVRNICDQDADVVDTHNDDAALCKENESFKSATAGNVPAIDLSTFPSAQFSAPSIPGAFAVENLLNKSSIHLEMLDSSSSSPSIQNDNNSDPTESYNGTLTATATVTLSTPLPMQQSHRDPELGNHRIVQAVCVENQKVFEAQIIPGDDIQDSKPHGSSSTLYRVILAVLLLLASITTSLSVILTRQKTFTESPSPTIVPSIYHKDREEMRAILSAILAPLALGGADVFDENSAEFSPTRKEALDWLLYEDRLRLPTDDKSFEWKIRQRYVLLLFYFSTNGPEWKEQLFFKKGQLDECAWGLVKRSKEDNYDDIDILGVVCNRLNKVVKIRMPWNNLSGTLPHELSNLSNSFVELDVGGGSLSGSIPPSFAKMTLLETFNVNDQCLSGTVPDFSNATKMQSFSIYNNPELSGSLNGFCNGTEVKTKIVNSKKLTLALKADCGGCTGKAHPSIECDCCETCCNEDIFECCNNLTGESQSTFKWGFVPKFKNQCLRDTSKQWIHENCPCIIKTIEGKCTKDCDKCTKDCNEEGAIRSYKYFHKT